MKNVDEKQDAEEKKQAFYSHDSYNKRLMCDTISIDTGMAVI